MVEFSFPSLPSPRNVEVDTFFFKFDLKIACKFNLNCPLHTLYEKVLQLRFVMNSQIHIFSLPYR